MHAGCLFSDVSGRRQYCGARSELEESRVSEQVANLRLCLGIFCVIFIIVQAQIWHHTKKRNGLEGPQTGEATLSIQTQFPLTREWSHAMRKSNILMPKPTGSIQQPVSLLTVTWHPSSKTSLPQMAHLSFLKLSLAAAPIPRSCLPGQKSRNVR